MKDKNNKLNKEFNKKNEGYNEDINLQDSIKNIDTELKSNIETELEIVAKEESMDEKNVFFRTFFKTFKSLSIPLMVGILLGILVSNNFLMYGFIPSESMVPAYNPGDRIVVNVRAYSNKQPKHGDIVVFNHIVNNKETKQIKRVIGVGGDHITLKEGMVYRNGKMLEEDYTMGHSFTITGTSDWIVPEGTLFLMGDNRENSLDSRGWENPFKSLEDVVGSPIMKLGKKEGF